MEYREHEVVPGKSGESGVFTGSDKEQKGQVKERASNEFGNQRQFSELVKIASSHALMYPVLSLDDYEHCPEEVERHVRVNYTPKRWFSCLFIVTQLKIEGFERFLRFDPTDRDRKHNPWVWHLSITAYSSSVEKPLLPVVMGKNALRWREELATSALRFIGYQDSKQHSRIIRKVTKSSNHYFRLLTEKEISEIPTF